MSLVQDYQLIANSRYFDAIWYLNRYKDVREQGINPLLHYINYGWQEMRNPGPYFSTRVYLYDNPDVKDFCPLLHFEKYGKKEGRKNKYEIIKRHQYIDEKWYKKNYQDVDYKSIDPIEHYILFGWKSDNSASKKLSMEKYKIANPDYVGNDICPLFHYEFQVNKSLRSISKVVVHFWGIYMEELDEDSSIPYFVFTTLQNDIFIRFNNTVVNPVEIKKVNSVICFEEYIKQEYKEDCIYFKADFFEKVAGNYFEVEHNLGYEIQVETLFMWSAISNKNLLGKKLFFFHRGAKVFALDKKNFLRQALKEVDRKTGKYLRLANLAESKDIILFSEFRNIANDNSWQLFNKCLEKGYDAYFVTSKNKYEKENDIHIKKHLIVYNSDEHKRLFIQCKKICCSWTLSDMVPTDFKHNCFLAPFWEKEWYYCPHGISYDKNSNFLTPIFLGQPKQVFCCSTNEAKYFSERCGLKNIEVTGYPRMDKWNEPNSEAILFDFTYRKQYTEDYFSIIGEVVNSVNRIFPNRKLRYLFHPAITPQLQKKIKAIINNKSVVYAHASNEEKFNLWFDTSKYLITDYSSVAYDFAYRNKAISIYYMPEGFTEGHYNLNPVFYEKCCGILTYTINELIHALTLKDIPWYIQERKDAFFAYQDNENSERVLKKIMD